MKPEFRDTIILENELYYYTSFSSINEDVEYRQEIIYEVEMKDLLDITMLVKMFASLKIL
tara:strand:- start:97 stop:276 length:180 start_codon:yes stop_codon:yes gene_type:complete